MTTRKPDERAEEPLERPLTFLLDEALHTVEPGARFHRLRALGDGVLYACGFFGEHFEARGVDGRATSCGIGTTAYGAASSMLRIAEARRGRRAIDIYGELAAKFAVFVEVLSDVADATIAQCAASSKQLLKLYERWLKTGSDRLAQALGRRTAWSRGAAARGSCSDQTREQRRRDRARAAARGERRRARARARGGRGGAAGARAPLPARPRRERRGLPRTKQTCGEREALLVREGDDGDIEMALRVPRLGAKVIDLARDADLDPLCQIIEGVSHFVYLADRARAEREATQLELELQAEVDKFVVLAAWLGEPDAGASATLRRRLYEDVSFAHDEATEHGDRYRLANERAHSFVRRLEREYVRRGRWGEMRAELWRFYRMGQEEKLRLARAA